MTLKWQFGFSARRPGEGRRAAARGKARRGRLWRPEGLEDRLLLSGQIYTVDATTDTGAGSGTSGDLRYAITQANANPGSTIQFAVSGTIALASELPTISADLTINGPGASNLTVQGTSFSRVLENNNATVAISGLTFAGGTSASNQTGGALFNNLGTVTLTGCTFTGNSSSGGGAIDNNSGTLNVAGCTFASNTATAFGGAIEDDGTATITNSTFTNNYSNDGGGAIFNRFHLTVTGCTFNGNSVGGIGRGGAIYNYFAMVTISNSTFVNSSADLGGALDNYYATSSPGASHAIATLTDVTITGSTAGGVVNEGDTVGDLTLVNSLIAGNSGGDVVGLVNSFGSTNNLIGDGSQSQGISNGSNGNQVGNSSQPINAMLGTLATNGGPTQTIALLAGSPALDGGSGAATTDTDQRGVARGKVLDIGAYQATATQLAVTGFPSPTAPGVSHSLSVSAVDPFNQVALDFNGSITFSSSDPLATLPAGGSLVSGQGSFSATLKTPGVQSITASAGGLSGSQAGIIVTGNPATASFIKQDATTQGSWAGIYGTQGYDIVSGPTSLPSGDTASPSGQSTYTWTTSSSDPRALQIPGSSNRVAAVWYSATKFTVNVNLSDGQPHDLELYFLDWDNKGRAETVQISDANTNSVLDTETISAFTSGVYLDWKVSGNLIITITRTAGTNAVLNGLFLDSTSAPPPATTASFIKQDPTTQGSWSGVYGAQGYDIVSGPTSLPAGDTATPSGQSTYTWTTSSSDPRALQVPGSSNRVAAVWYSATKFTVNVNLSDGQTHDLELYFLDWDNKGRAETVQISDANTNSVLDTENISAFSSGVYLDWKVSGNLLITITRQAGANAVLNGLFLDPTSAPPPAATASFIKQDATTQGSWSGVYGAQGYDIVSGPTSLPAGDSAAPSGQSTYTWTTTSSDPRALQVPGSSNRVAAVWYSATKFTVNVDLNDGQPHDLELYFLDWDNKGRAETVQISDANTNSVLDTETISAFTSGVYLDWKVSGNLLITITRQAGANAVLNGLFLDAAQMGGAAYQVGASSSGNIGPPSRPITAGAPIALGSTDGLAISPAAGAVDAVLGALPEYVDATLPTADSAIHDLAVQQVSDHGAPGQFSRRWREM